MTLAYSIATEGVNSGFKAMAALGYSLANFSIIYTPTGGVIIDGNAIYQPLRSFSFDGYGVISLGGTNALTTIKDFVADGGLIYLTGDVSGVKDKNYLGIGGIVTDGTGPFSISRVGLVGFNDIIIDGSSHDSVAKEYPVRVDGPVTGGTYLVVTTKVPVPYGGIDLGGSAIDAKEKYYLGYGDITSDGSAAWALGRSYQTITSPIVTDGLASLVKIKIIEKSNYVTDIFTDGTWSGNIVKSISPTGGIEVSGSSYNIKLKYAIPPTGGVVTDGGNSYSKNTIWDYSVITTTIDLAGLGQIAKVKSVVSTGQVDTDGTAGLQKVKDFSASGQVTFDGTAALAKIKEVIGYGDTYYSGTADVAKVKDIVSPLQVIVSGGYGLVFIKNYDGLAEVVTDGSAQILKIKIPQVGGQVDTDGSSAYRNLPLRSTVYVNEAVTKTLTPEELVSKMYPSGQSSTDDKIQAIISDGSEGSSKINRAPENSRTSFHPAPKSKVNKQTINVGSSSRPNRTVSLTKGSNKVKL